MGKYVDNKTNATNRKKAKANYQQKIKGSVGLKKYYTEQEKLKSQAQAKTDAAIQAKIVANRNK